MTVFYILGISFRGGRQICLWVPEFPLNRPVKYYCKSKRFYDRDPNHQHISAHQVEFPHFAPCAIGGHASSWENFHLKRISGE